jgi:predicted DNA-binding protein
MEREKRSESLTFRLPLSTSRWLNTLSQSDQLSKGRYLCNLIEREAKRLRQKIRSGLD